MNKFKAQLSKQGALDSLNSKGILSESGTDWLKMALDPFHDETVAIAGMPDADAGDSIVQVFKQKISVTKPANFPPGKWDAHISVLPIQEAPTPVETSVGLPLIQASAAGVKPSTTFMPNDFNSLQLGTVVVNSAMSGVETWPGDAFANKDTNAYQAWGDPQNFDSKSFSPELADVSPMSKIIGGGFEVHNDTEMLHKGGSVTMYCMPQARSDNIVFQVNNHPDAVAPESLCECVTIRQPPSTPQEAQLFPNSRTLSAKDGCYVPFYLDTETSTFECHTSKVLRTRKEEKRDDLNPAGFGYVSAGVTASSKVFNAQLGAQNLKMASLESCGSYFTGLSDETVLTLTIRYVVESRPTAANPSMLSLASQTALYDPLALELYRAIRASLPVGVPVNFNAKGDWFRMAMSHVGDALITASPLISLLGPEFGAVSLAAGTAAKTLGAQRKSVPGRATTNAQKLAPRNGVAKK